MDWKLELVVVPVTDVDRAKRFYGEQLGFVVDHDSRIGDDMRVVQLTPPGSACSIAIGTGPVGTAPGSLEGLQLVVPDLDAARAQLVERGVEASPIQHYEGPTGSTAGAAPGTRSCSSPTPTATGGSSRSARPASLQAEPVAALACCKLDRSPRAWRNRQTRRV